MGDPAARISADDPPGATAITSPTTASERDATWKQVLALLSLSLSLLLWTNGLLDSLQRPSVSPALDRRQLELAVLAAPALEGSVGSAVVGSDPQERLLEALLDDPASLQSGRERVLLELLARRTGRSLPPSLPELPSGDPGPAGALARALSDPTPDAASLPDGSGAEDPLLARLSCQVLGAAAPEDCVAAGEARAAAVKLAMVSVLPLLLLLGGLGLIARLAWCRWRRSLPPEPPLRGPDLTLVDVTLLIAGGFVVLGETVVPLLALPLAQAVTTALGLEPPRSEALGVVLLYSSLMALPLMILALMLRGRPPIEGGLLQWRWRPLGSGLRLAGGGVLMVLPLVSLAGWLAQRWFGEGGGSNPLLEVVLGSRDGLSLFCLAFTATVLAPWFEELLFRGVLLPVLVRRQSRLLGLVGSALVFAAAHLSLGELLPLLVLGFALGWLRLSSGRLAPCVLMHALWNGFTFANLIVLGG
ncbi:CPBP family intramembrane metalloprotease [Synechococcus sp. RSCCF101]|uniref:type II CAAX endopeptidase family protein n=1 Tax=Synechococcus sp. RSCCF101 TaxID=2511069 RepID=UPI0012482770|nr:type II CAAX endopeptidase family protein [Synechococcus sp. RSCCF101]QEY31380.1 CPBP family intramembrane metalloprotease [Synechococcus sp. RSCCF101]